MYVAAIATIKIVKEYPNIISFIYSMILILQESDLGVKMFKKNILMGHQQGGAKVQSITDNVFNLNKS